MNSQIKQGNRAQQYQQQYRLENKEKIAAAKKRCYDTNKEHYLDKAKNYREAKPDVMTVWRRNNRVRINNYNKTYVAARVEVDPLFKLKTTIRKITCKAIARAGYIKNSKTADILGCSFEEFQRHIQNKFLSGMHWNNHGRWHIDHKIPLASASSKEELLKLSHYTNLQPLWAKDNLAKGSKIYAT